MEYFLIKPNGETTGTYSIEQVRSMLAAGFIDQDVRYWHEGITGWQPIDRIEESLKFEPPAAAPTPAKAVPAQKIAAALKAVPPAATKLEKKTTPGEKPRREAPAIPLPGATATRTPSSEVGDDVPPGEDYPVPEKDETVAYLPAPKPKSNALRWIERFAFVFLGMLLTVVALRGPAVLRYISDKLTDKLVVTESTNFVLVDAATIKSFNQDMQETPMVENLKNQITQTDDPVAVQRLKAGIANEITRHAEEIRQQYLRANSAETIDPGSYVVVAYYDEQGNPTTSPRMDQPCWVGITYREHTVYAFKTPETVQTTPANP